MRMGGEHRGGKRGRGSENKTPFVAALALNEEHHPIAMNLNVVKGFRNSEIKHWAGKHLESGSLVYSDGLACFSAVLDQGCHHYSSHRRWLGQCNQRGIYLDQHHDR